MSNILPKSSQVGEKATTSSLRKKFEVKGDGKNWELSPEPVCVQGWLRPALSLHGAGSDEGNGQDGTLGTRGPHPDATQSLASGSYPCHLPASR